MRTSDIIYLKGVFGKYYARHSSGIRVPDRIECREFGYQSFGTGWNRHIRLADSSELKRFLVNTSPMSTYCSVSYYDEPAAQPMEAKKWKGADLIFDIDAKDLELACRKDHAVYVCRDCCKAHPVSTTCCAGKQGIVSLPCDKCVGAAKRSAAALVKIIVDSFGADKPTVKTYFSGNEGYHVHVDDPTFHGIESYGRGELVKYVAEHDVLVDARVTTDLTRIFRTPGTLSSKSGMAKMECADPFVDAVVLGDAPTAVHADCPHRFTLKGRRFGPYNSERTEVPEYVAVYMVLKELAHVV